MAVLPQNGSVTLTAIPHGSTANRLLWSHLPPHLRSVIEGRCGSPVVAATSVDAGYSAGMATVLETMDGRRHFVKAASVVAQRQFADSYRNEARNLRALGLDGSSAGSPHAALSPRLRWTVIDPEWVVLGFDHHEHRPVGRPWTSDDLAVALELTERLAQPRDPGSYDRSAFAPIGSELASWPGAWRLVPTERLGLTHGLEAAALATRFESAAEGEVVTHTDLRGDKILLTDDGPLAIDWAWPVLAAEWVDTVLVLIGAAGAGLDVDTALAAHPLTARVDPERIDAVLALYAGYLLAASLQPSPTYSPYVRSYQRSHGLDCYRWLARRRGWPVL